MARKRRQDIRVGREGRSVKWCSVCKCDHGVEAFSRNASNASGLATQCREAIAAAWRGERGERRKAELRAERSTERALRPAPPPYAPPADKCCSKCREVKPLEAFSTHHQTRDGRNSWCKACFNAYCSAAVKADRSKANEYKRLARRAAGRPERPHSAHVAAYDAEQKRLRAEARERAREVEKHDAHVAAYRKRSYRYRAPPGKNRLKKLRRKAAIRQATPAWANPDRIKEWYAASKVAERDTGYPWHVDHIVPLRSPIVCGLHCEANLVALPGALNVEKSNTRWPDMPE